ncbi:hypothetical protein, partial [Parabacteroides sp.]
MESLETLKQCIREAKLEEAIRLLNRLDDKSSTGERLKNQCLQNLSEQYIYQIKECISQHKVREGLSVIDRYREYVGDDMSLMKYQDVLIGMQTPVEKIRYKLLHTKSYKATLFFILLEVVCCCLLFYIHDRVSFNLLSLPSVGVYVLALVCISIASTALFISMRSIHNSIEMTYNKNQLFYYLDEVCMVALFLCQLLVLLVFFMQNRGYLVEQIPYLEWIA